MATYSNDASSKVEAAATSDFGIQTIVNIVPRNPVKAAVDLDMLGIIFFGMIFGAALTMIRPEKAKPMLAFLEALNDIVIKIVEIAMRLAPFGVAALIFGVTSRFGFDIVRLLGMVRRGSSRVAPDSRPGQHLGDHPVSRRDVAVEILQPYPRRAGNGFLNELEQRDSSHRARNR